MDIDIKKELENFNKASLYAFLGRILNRLSSYNRYYLSSYVARVIINYMPNIFAGNIKVNYNHLYPYFSKKMKFKYFNWKIYAFDVLRNYLFEQTEIMILPFKMKNEFKRYPIYKKFLKKSYLLNEGGILVAPHVSGWESVLLIAGLVFPGKILTVVESKNINKDTYEFFQKIRTLTGVKVLPVESSKREMILHLKNNGILVIVGDRDIMKTGWEIPFFGEKARLPNGAVSLSYLTGKNIIIGVALRNRDLSLDGEILGVMSPEGLSKHDVRNKFFQTYVKFMEEAIMKSPTEWFVFYPVWN